MNNIKEWEHELSVKLGLLEKIIGRQIPKTKNKLFTRAIMNSQAFKEYIDIKPNELHYFTKYQYLETYGDAVIDLIVCKQIYDKGDSNIQMTLEKERIVNNNHLNELSKILFMEIAILRNYSAEDTISFANVLEQITAAIYVTFGYKFTSQFLKIKGLF